MTMRRILIILGASSLLIALSFATTIDIAADGGANHRGINTHFGVSGGNVRDSSRRFCCSGTLGSLVRDNNGVQYILSNNHVLGLAGAATVGDDISQPGLIDNNCRVATIVADFTAAPALNSNVDAAIAQLRSGTMDTGGFIEDIGTISSVVKAPSVGLGVAKSGRTTGFTTGNITSINTSVSVRYPRSCGSNNGPSFTFTNQVVVGNQPGFSGGGDSGSLIVTSNSCNQPVALLFAGSNTSTIGNPISDVLNRVSGALGGGRTVSFVGDNCSAAAALESSANPSRFEGPSQESVEIALNVMKGRVAGLMSRSGVIGVGVGTSDLDAGDAAIIVYVDQTAGLQSRMPRWIDGVRVVRIFTDPFVAF